MKQVKLTHGYILWQILLVIFLPGCRLDQSGNKIETHIVPVETVGRKNIDPNDVPPLVSKSLSLLFSNYTLIGWQECHSFYLNDNEDEIHLYRDEVPSYYRAKILKDGNKIAVFFKQSGEFIRWEKFIHSSQLPEKIKSAVNNTKYKNWSMDEQLTEIFKDRNYNYRIHLDSGQSNYFVEFNKNGEILHQHKRMNYILHGEMNKELKLNKNTKAKVSK